MEVDQLGQDLNRDFMTSQSFSDGSNSDWFCGLDQHNDCLFNESTSDIWVDRSINRDAMGAGKTIVYFLVQSNWGLAPGPMDILLSDVNITTADGTILPILGRPGSTAAVNGNGCSLADVNWTPQLPATCNYEVFDSAGTSPQTTFMLADHLGSSAMEFTAGGAPLSFSTFKPFGGEINPPVSSNHYKFTGKERDAESGLDYFGRRYYGSSTGRFLSPDPYNAPLIKQKMAGGGLPEEAAATFMDGFLENPQNWNEYAYVRNNPLGLVDRTGAFAGPPDGHHLIPMRSALRSPFVRDFADKIKTGPLSGNSAPNQPGFGGEHREYNAAVEELAESLEQTEGDRNSWGDAQWRGFANQILNSSNAAIKGFLDSLEKNNPGAKAALTTAISAYRASASVIARAAIADVAAAAAAATRCVMPFFFICIQCHVYVVKSKVVPIV